MNYEPEMKDSNEIEDVLQHWGVKGMKWKKKKKKQETPEEAKADLDRRVKANKAVLKYKYGMSDKDKKLSREQSKYAFDRTRNQTKAPSKVSRAFQKVKGLTLGKINKAKNNFFKSMIWDGGHNKAMIESRQRESLNNANRNLYNLRAKRDRTAKRAQAAQRDVSQRRKADR